MSSSSVGKTTGKAGKKKKVRMLSGGDQPALLDKAAAKMVEQVRLQSIEKENKSVGALLDTRTLHKLEEPKVGLNNRAKAKLDTQKRVESRRMGRAEEELKRESEAAINTMMAKGIDIVKTINFDNEELIWHTKSSDPNYSKKRRFDDPELQSFKNNLSVQDRRMFKSLCHQALVDMATKYREEIEIIRADMDMAGVFHPEANAHRAHCMYLMKLYAGIRAETIENPVLRKIRADGIAKRVKQEQEEQRQRDLILSFENKGRDGKKAGVSVQETMAAADAELEKQKKDSEDMQAANLEKLEEKKGAEQKAARKAAAAAKAANKGGSSKRISQPPLKKGKSLPAINHPGAATLVAKEKSSNAAGGANNKDSSGSTYDGSASPTASIADDSTVDENMLDDAKLSPAERKAAEADAKMFKKMKMARLGGADPRSMLKSDADRLNDSDVQKVVKLKERSSLVDLNTTQWMLNLLQDSQIHKSSEGRELAPAQAGLMASDAFGASIDSPQKLGKGQTATKGGEDPQRVIPFGEFYDMFKTYTESATTDQALRSMAVEQNQRAIPQAPNDGWEPAETDFHSKVGMEDSLPSLGMGGDMGSGDSAAPSAGSSARGTVKFRPSDTLKDLAEADPSFEAYMKIQRRQQPQGQRLFRGKISKQSKRRPHNPLGQKAVCMTDSKGTATVESAKGFTNVFNTMEAGDSSSEEEVEEENAFLGGGGDDDDNAGDAEPSPSKDGGNGGGADAAATVTTDGTGTVSSTNIGVGSPPARASSRPGSRNRRGTNSRGGNSRNGSRKGGQMADADYEETEGKDLQAKLMAAFNALQTPALVRLSFMRKYATPANACNFNRAIDRIAESAILALARDQLVNKNRIKLREGYAVLPLLASSLLADFKEQVPALLSSRAPALCMMTSFNGPLSDPASVSCLSTMEKMVHSIFPDDRADDGADNCMTADFAEELLLELEGVVEALLHKLDGDMHEELGDHLEVQGKSLNDWLKRFRPPVKKLSDEGKDGKK